MKTLYEKDSNEINKLEKVALWVFLPCAAITYALSLTYCYTTKHFTELGMTAGAAIALTIFIVSIIKSK